MKTRIALAALLALASLLAHRPQASAQFDNSALFFQRSLPERQGLYLRANSLFFNKNNEYFNRIADGYTLFGNQSLLAVGLVPGHGLELLAGVFAQKDFGTTGWRHLQPELRVRWRPDSLSQLILGTLDGPLLHQMLEPVYDFERALELPQEWGLQYRRAGRLAQLDAWIAWDRMLYPGDSLQERMGGGLRADLPLALGERLSALAQAQLTGMHRGGQIDASPEPLETAFNSALGLRLEAELAGPLLRKFWFSAHSIGWKDFSPNYKAKFEDGHGWFLNLGLEREKVGLVLSYWQADEFLSTHGGDLYVSASRTYKHPTYLLAHRQLIVLRYWHQVPIGPDASLVSRFEPHYDPAFRRFEFSMGLYLNFGRSFRLLDELP